MEDVKRDAASVVSLPYSIIEGLSRLILLKTKTCIPCLSYAYKPHSKTHLWLTFLVLCLKIVVTLSIIPEYWTNNVEHVVFCTGINIKTGHSHCTPVLFTSSLFHSSQNNLFICIFSKTFKVLSLFVQVLQSYQMEGNFRTIPRLSYAEPVSVSSTQHAVNMLTWLRTSSNRSKIKCKICYT